MSLAGVGAEFAGAHLIVSAAVPQQFPPATGVGELEIAFLGRSNVGKSSLLNRLVQGNSREGHKLAFTSSQPGCTQQINFFDVGGGVRFVDLPGYGYARVSLEERAAWKQLIDSYLLHRKNLALSLLLIDARRGWMTMDLELKSWLEFHNRRFQVVATKVDKFKSRNQFKAGFDAIRKQVPVRVSEDALEETSDMGDANLQAIPFSAVDGRGVREIWQIISKIKKQQ